MDFKELLEEDFKDVDIYDSKLPNPIAVREWRGLQDREIYINYPITDELINLSLEIINWNKMDNEINLPIEDRIPIKIFINSDGGDLDATLNLIDIIEISKTPVYTIGMSKCYSSGAILLISGHKRFAFNNTSFLLHDGCIEINNYISKAIDSVKFIEKRENNLRKYILSKTNITKSLYDKKYNEDNYLTSDEMIKYDIVDEIISDISKIY